MRLSFDKAIVNMIRYCKTPIYYHKNDSVDALTGLGSVIIIQQWALKRDALSVSPTRMGGVSDAECKQYKHEMILSDSALIRLGSGF
jgi:hypothetical protein